VLDRALPVAEDQTRARLARAEAGAVDQPAGSGVLADELAHLVDELDRRRVPRLGLRIVLVHHHETHGRPPGVRGGPAPAGSFTNASIATTADRRDRASFCKS
jgi:hypothetical protein